MFPIKSFKQLQVAYVFLRYYEGGLKDPNQRDKELVAENVKEVKAVIQEDLKNFHLLAREG